MDLRREPEQVFATIVEGRPNGMPSFGGKIPDYQVWQLVAYVRSMSGLVVEGCRAEPRDDMSAKTPEASTETMRAEALGGPCRSGGDAAMKVSGSDAQSNRQYRA